MNNRPEYWFRPSKDPSVWEKELQELHAQCLEFNPATELVLSSSHTVRDEIARRNEVKIVCGASNVMSSEISLLSILINDEFVKTICSMRGSSNLRGSILRLAASLSAVTQNHGAYKRSTIEWSANQEI